MRTQRNPASAIIFISPGSGSVKWMLTPNPLGNDCGRAWGVHASAQRSAARCVHADRETTSERRIAVMRIAARLPFPLGATEGFLPLPLGEGRGEGAKLSENLSHIEIIQAVRLSL